jgi:hypothetical protein
MSKGRQSSVMESKQQSLSVPRSIFVSASVAPAGTEWLRGGGSHRRPFAKVAGQAAGQSAAQAVKVGLLIGWPL